MTATKTDQNIKYFQAKIPEQVKNEIKARAIIEGLTIHDFVVKMFETYKKQNPEK